MVTEIAQLDVKPGMEAQFEAAIAKGRDTVLTRSKGYKSLELHRSIETPSRYVLQIKWDTLESHTVDFRGSDLFQEWRGIVGSFFASPPHVEHTNTVLK